MLLARRVGLADFVLHVWPFARLPTFAQVEHDEVIYFVTKSLMATNETKSDAYGESAMEALQAMLDFNNDLFIGNGYSGVLDLTNAEARSFLLACLLIFLACSDFVICVLLCATALIGLVRGGR